MKQLKELAPNTVFNVSIKGMGSPYQIAQDLLKIAKDLVSNTDGTIEPEELISAEWEYRTVVAQFDLLQVEQDEQLYTLLDEHPSIDDPRNLVYDMVGERVLTFCDEEYEELKETAGFDAYFIAVKH